MVLLVQYLHCLEAIEEDRLNMIIRNKRLLDTIQVKLC